MSYRKWLRAQDKFVFVPKEMNPGDRELFYDFIEEMYDNRDSRDEDFKKKLDIFNEYVISNINSTKELFKNRMNGFKNYLPKIERVIFNDPATIVFWSDGNKTVVKCRENDTYDPEKGLAMAISKKAIGNGYKYYNVFLKHLKKYNKENNDQEV